MDIKNPEYILEIARQQSVTHAAEKLFVTQSTLSQYLLKLENELGTPLFSREKSGLVPTEAGHVYLHAARAVVQIQNAAEASIAALKKEGFLCVGVSFWGLMLLTGLLPAFKSRFPDITLRIFVDDYAHLKVMMQAGRIDLAVISITEEDDRPAQGAVNLRRKNWWWRCPGRRPIVWSTRMRSSSLKSSCRRRWIRWTSSRWMRGPVSAASRTPCSAG